MIGTFQIDGQEFHALNGGPDYAESNDAVGFKTSMVYHGKLFPAS